MILTNTYSIKNCRKLSSEKVISDLRLRLDTCMENPYKLLQEMLGVRVCAAATNPEEEAANKQVVWELVENAILSARVGKNKTEKYDTFLGKRKVDLIIDEMLENYLDVTAQVELYDIAIAMMRIPDEILDVVEDKIRQSEIKTLTKKPSAMHKWKRFAFGGFIYETILNLKSIAEKQEVA